MIWASGCLIKGLKDRLETIASLFCKDDSSLAMWVWRKGIPDSRGNKSLTGIMREREGREGDGDHETEIKSKVNWV